MSPDSCLNKVLPRQQPWEQDWAGNTQDCAHHQVDTLVRLYVMTRIHQQWWDQQIDLQGENSERYSCSDCTLLNVGNLNNITLFSTFKAAQQWSAIILSINTTAIAAVCNIASILSEILLQTVGNRISVIISIVLWETPIYPTLSLYLSVFQLTDIITRRSWMVGWINTVHLSSLLLILCVYYVYYMAVQVTFVLMDLSYYTVDY